MARRPAARGARSTVHRPAPQRRRPHARCATPAGVAGTWQAGALRRIRRTADCSQRELADHLGVSKATVAAVETGARDLSSELLVRAADLAGLRVALVDAGGQEVPVMSGPAARDRAGRRFPAHLDTRTATRTGGTAVSGTAVTDPAGPSTGTGTCVTSGASGPACRRSTCPRSRATRWPAVPPSAGGKPTSSGPNGSDGGWSRDRWASRTGCRAAPARPVARTPRRTRRTSATRPGARAGATSAEPLLP